MPSRRHDPIRILLLAANPEGSARLGLDREARDIQEVLERADVAYEVRHITAVRPRDIPRSLRRFRPDFVHFSGHGEKGNGMVLEDPLGNPSSVPKEALASLFSLLKGIKCVVLNSCYSLDQAQLISEYVPYVIGMRSAISDPAALEFSYGFYQAIGDGESISSAFEYGKTAILLANISEWDVPHLLHGAFRRPFGSRKQRRTTSHESNAATLADSLHRTRDLARPITKGGSQEPIDTSELAQLPWKDFEVFALRVIEAMYHGTGMRFTHTRYCHDGGKDGEAQYILGVGLEKAFQISFRVWLEVKQRRERNVTKGDVASHLVDALLGHIDKIIFITNRSFSAGIETWMETFSARTGLQYQLIDGTTLLSHAQVFLGPSRSHDQPKEEPVSPAAYVREVAPAVDMKITCWFALTPAIQKGPKPNISLRPDRPFFLVVDILCSEQLQPVQFEIRVKISQRESPSVVPWPLGGPLRPLLASANERLRQLYLIWPDNKFESTDSTFRVEVTSTRPLTVKCDFLNRIQSPHPVLADFGFRRQEQIYASLEQRVDRLKLRGGCQAALLVAPPGVGKSRLVARVRRHCHELGLQEAFLDCESVYTDVDLIAALCRLLLPFPSDLLDAELVEPLKEWCTQVGIGSDTAAQIAQDLCRGTDSASKVAARYRVEVASAIITWSANVRHLVLFVEDLHKAAPSLLSLLSALIARLSSAGASGVLVLASSRPYFSGNPNLKAEWLAAFGGVSGMNGSMLIELSPPVREEGRRLLQASVHALEDYHADAILEVAGTTPFLLRETLLYLLARDVVRFTAFEQQRLLTIANPAGFKLALGSRDLGHATEQRLRLFLDNQPDWLRSLVLGGATYGRRFPLQVLIEALKLTDDIAFAEALDSCSAWSVLALSSEGSEWLEFDHDLVRESVLLLGPRRMQRAVSRVLLETLGQTADVQVRCRLAYQADLPEVCLAAANSAREQAKAEGRVADIIELNQIALHVLDPAVATALLSELERTGDQYLLDPAFRSAGSPTPVAVFAEQRLRLVLDLLLDSIESLATVGSGSSPATAAAISEARLIAEKLREPLVIAKLAYLEGRMWFERNSLQRAVTLHQEAENLFLLHGGAKDSARAENLVRQAICLRRSGQIGDSISLLWRAARSSRRGDWVLINKVRNNLGAAFLHSDWGKVRYHWEKQILQAEHRGLVARRVHGLASLSFIDIFEGRLDDGLSKAKTALDLSEHFHLDNQTLRLCLNCSVHAIITGQLAEAKAYLIKGEQIALQHGIGRRLWRVTANLATLYELDGHPERSFARDLQTIRQLESSLSGLRVDGREILAIVNLVLRGRAHAGLASLLADVPSEVKSVAEAYSQYVLADQKYKLPNLLGNYCVMFSVGPRFLITE